MTQTVHKNGITCLKVMIKLKEVLNCVSYFKYVRAMKQMANLPVNHVVLLGVRLFYRDKRRWESSTDSVVRNAVP